MRLEENPTGPEYWDFLTKICAPWLAEVALKKHIPIIPGEVRIGESGKGIYLEYQPISYFETTGRMGRRTGYWKDVYDRWIDEGKRIPLERLDFKYMTFPGYRGEKVIARADLIDGPKGLHNLCVVDGVSERGRNGIAKELGVSPPPDASDFVAWQKNVWDYR